MLRDKKEPIANEGYMSLAPVDDISNTGYLEALDWALAEQDVYNVALSGPNGSGKSSIIKTYLRRHKEIDKKALVISMSAFQEIENADSCEGEAAAKNKQKNTAAQEDEHGEGELKERKNGENETRKIKRDEIETGILTQLFYKVGYWKIPRSRYRRLHKISWLKIWGIILLCLFFFFVLCSIFTPTLKTNILGAIATSGEAIHASAEVSYVLFAALLVGICALIALAVRGTSPRFRVKEIKLSTNLTLQRDEDDERTIFNKNMDEIVYFFEATGYWYVFFEDLDRLNDAGVFIHLRELNLLLNRCDAIKHSIIFIYAVRDDIFTKEDRTKFFDFMIPVVPYVSAANSVDEFLKWRKDSNKNGSGYDISEEFVTNVSLYIDDMRILQNICNEFILYKKTVATDQGLSLHDEKIMAMIIFKNLYPREFADTQKGEGLIEQAFHDKEKFIEKQRIELEGKIKAESDDIQQYEESILVQVNEVKTAMLGALTDWEGMFTSVVDKNGSKTYSADQIMEETFDYMMLLDMKQGNVSYRTWKGANKPNNRINDISSVVEPYIEKLRVIQRVEEKGAEDIHQNMEVLREEVRLLRGRSIKDLIAEYGAEQILGDNVNENKFLCFMLKSGYIDENYATYINYFKEGSVTLADKQFILSVKNEEPLSFEYKLTRTDNIIKYLQPHEFEEAAAANFNLLDALLDGEDNNNQQKNDQKGKGDVQKAKLENLISKLSDESENSWAFIDEFIERTKHQERFIELLVASWTNMWDVIVSKTDLSYERKCFYFSQLICAVPIIGLKTLNSSRKSVAAFFNAHPDILQYLPPEKSDKVISVLEQLDVIFDDVPIENVSEDILDDIFEHCRYSLNMTMTQKIVAYREPKLLNGVRTQNYTVVSELGFDPLSDYIHNNIEIYVENVVLEESNTQETTANIVDLLERTLDVPEMGIKILEHENCLFENFMDCCGVFVQKEQDGVRGLWDTLLNTGKIRMTWENMYTYWENYAFTEELISYIEKHADTLKDIQCECVQDDFIEEFITSSVADETFKKMLPSLRMQVFRIPMKEISETKISLMIDDHYFDFDVTRYQELQDVYPDQAIHYILCNQDTFMEARSEMEITADLLQKLLSDRQMRKENCQILLSEFDEKLMTREIAETVYQRKLSLDSSEFELIWEFLDAPQRQGFMIEHLNMLTCSQFEKCFISLGNMYPGFSDRARRHNVSMRDTPENRKLAERLQVVEYITSWKLETSQAGIRLFGNDIEHTVITCTIKKYINSVLSENK